MTGPNGSLPPFQRRGSQALPTTSATPATPGLPVIEHDTESSARHAERRSKSHVLAVANQKGGSGKTTTAVNAAAVLADRGHRVLLIDLDPQCTATRWLATPPINHGLSQLLDGQRDVSDLTTPTGIAGLELVPGDGYLAGAERMLAGLPVPQTRVRRALSAVAAYDLVLIDCPPALGLLTVNALAAASGLIVPVAAQAMELDGLADLQQTIAAVRDGLGHDVAIDAVVACRVRTRTTLARDVIDGLRHVHGDVVLNTVVRDNVRVAEAYAWQEPVTVYNPECAGAHDHYAVAVELETRIWP